MYVSATLHQCSSLYGIIGRVRRVILVSVQVTFPPCPSGLRDPILRPLSASCCTTLQLVATLCNEDSCPVQCYMASQLHRDNISQQPLIKCYHLLPLHPSPSPTLSSGCECEVGSSSRPEGGRPLNSSIDNNISHHVFSLC